MGSRSLPGRRRPASAGFSVLEVLIAAFILGLIGTAVVTTGLKSRTQVDYEEVRRKAIALAQERLETLRGSVDYDAIPSGNVNLNLDGTAFTIGTTFFEGLVVTADTMDTYAKTVTATVTWTATGGGKSLNRQVKMTTLIFRGL